MEQAEFIIPSLGQRLVFPILQVIFAILIAGVIYSLLLIAPPTVAITRIAYFRDSFLVITITTLILFFFAVWRHQSHLGEITSLVHILSRFALTIAYKWQVPVYVDQHWVLA